MAETKIHAGVKVKRAGLFISLTHPYLAASPDGIFQCSCHPTEEVVIEVKCPYSHRDSTLGAAKNDDKFCLFLEIDGSLHFKIIKIIHTTLRFSIFIHYIH